MAQPLITTSVPGGFNQLSALGGQTIPPTVTSPGIGSNGLFGAAGTAPSQPNLMDVIIPLSLLAIVSQLMTMTQRSLGNTGTIGNVGTTAPGTTPGATPGTTPGSTPVGTAGNIIGNAGNVTSPGTPGSSGGSGCACTACTTGSGTCPAASQPAANQPAGNAGGAAAAGLPGAAPSKFMNPLDKANISSNFGPRGGVPHEGTDFAAPMGTPIKATADGVVKSAGVNGGYGNAIDLDHGGGTTSRYGHLSSFVPNLKPGQTVKAGDIIGFVGSTGDSTGPHLHFEIRRDGKAVNPAPLLNQ